MNIRKKAAALFFTAAVIFTGFSAALAKSYPDVSENYWAIEEIDDVVTKNIVPLYNDGRFRPEEKVPRVDWTEWLLRALGLSQSPIDSVPVYSDVNPQTYGYDSIARSDKFGLIYGYTDGEFKPQRLITKTETASIMSHITKSSDIDTRILNRFTDADQIPAWGVFPYAKAVSYGLYVNYPNESELNPNRQLNRAEAAVLLSRLMKALNLVEDKYKAEEPQQVEQPAEYLLSVEHLQEYPKALNDRVNITNLRRIILEKNVFKAAFLEKFNSAKAQMGDEAVFYFKKDVITSEGTLLIPADTKLYGRIQEITNKRWLNRNAKVDLYITKMVFPNGREYPFMARILNKYDGILTENRWLKPLEYTVAGAAIGAGAIGLPIGASDDHIAAGTITGGSIGAGAGLAAGLITPGVNFKAHSGEEVWVELLEDSSIYNDYVQQTENNSF